MRFFKNQRGISIIEGTIGLSITIMAGLAMSQVIQSMGRSSGGITATAEFEQQVNLVKQYLLITGNSQYLLPTNQQISNAPPNNVFAIPQIPRATTSPTSLAPVGIGVLMTATGAAPVPAGLKFKIVAITLNISANAPMAPTSTIKQYQAQLVIDGLKATNTGGAQNMSRTIDLLVLTNNVNEFQSTNATDSAAFTLPPRTCPTGQVLHSLALVNNLPDCVVAGGGGGGALNIFKGTIQRCNSTGVTIPEGAIWIEDRTLSPAAPACVF